MHIGIRSNLEKMTGLLMKVLRIEALDDRMCFEQTTAADRNTSRSFPRCADRSVWMAWTCNRRSRQIQTGHISA